MNGSNGSGGDHPETIVRIVTIVTLGAVLLAAVAGLTVVAVTTDRDLMRAEALTFAGVVLLAALGGVSWLALRRRGRHWRVRVNHDDGPDQQSDMS